MKQLHPNCSAVVVAIWIALISAPSGVLAADKLFLTGIEGSKSDNFYTFVGLVAPIGDNSLGDGWVQKYWLDYLGYTYNTDQRITAKAVGVEAMLGYQTSGPTFWAGVFTGLRYNNTSLEPDDPGNETSGEHIWLKTQFEGGMDLAENWKTTGIASYTFGAKSYWLRTRLKYSLSKDLFTGPEVAVMGDPNYQAWQLGWFVTGFEPSPGFFIGVKGSARFEGSDVNGLVGIELVKIF